MSSGMVELPIVTEQVDIDLNEKERMVQTDAVMFPCRASGLVSKKRMYYLDETPDLEGDVTLIGCDLSRRIFRSTCGRVLSVDMCPKNLVKDDGTPTIIKCCKVKVGHEVVGNIACVPWGDGSGCRRCMNALSVDLAEACLSSRLAIGRVASP